MSSQLYRPSRLPICFSLVLIALFTVFGIFMLDLRSLDPSDHPPIHRNHSTYLPQTLEKPAANSRLVMRGSGSGSGLGSASASGDVKTKTCATVEEMGEIFRRGYVEESLQVRRTIRHHFSINGAARVRELKPQEFCRHGFVIGKASEAGLGNELYKILTAAALSVMLNRSLIIGQTRGRYPFGDFVSYSNVSFTLKEVKHLWRQNRCLTRYGRHLTMRIDDFQKPTKTDVLCSNWRKWVQPIIWFQNTTDAVAAQFFLKNIHSEMREVASNLFGNPENLQYRANVFGELMRILIYPSRDVEQAVHWALDGRTSPDIALHMRMMMNRSVRAKNAALRCMREAVRNVPVVGSKPKVVLVSDTPSMVKDICPSLEEFAEVVHFDYKRYEGNVSGAAAGAGAGSPNTQKSNKVLDFRVKDWGPAPRWVAFVDFFLAARAKHGVVSGAHRRVGTTYVQLIAALAAAYRLDESKSASNQSSIAFLSSFQSNALSEGLKNQVGWGHAWNRFAGPLSCRGQAGQCAPTPILPPAWWDGLWQSPIPRDSRRMEAYGVRLTGLGTFDGTHLNDFCRARGERERETSFDFLL
ncbi:uncharacterized protein LOC127243415 isoform X2 [Andrographis paniculata]|uniref:uncharacterized protein LOC127243415 isoform X2 n=1 Tax=Andrographis paniculata TaxID=175694 RepID=UPI0021E8212E|nr:uncharacterized protein LOC127243415 isoform X2 [Andrographis paniculata]